MNQPVKNVGRPASEPKRIALAVANISRDTVIDHGSWGRNVYLEHEPGGELMAARRPGLNKLFAQAGSSQGLFNYNGFAYSVVNDTLNQLYLPAIAWSTAVNTALTAVSIPSFVSNGTAIVALTAASAVYYSSDGITFTSAGFTAVGLVFAVNGLFFAVKSSDHKLYSSVNGSVWTLVTATMPANWGNWSAIVYNTASSSYYGYDITNGLYYKSSDAGVTWVSQGAVNSSIQDLISVFYLEGNYVYTVQTNSLYAEGSGQYTSTDPSLPLTAQALNGLNYPFAGGITLGPGIQTPTGLFYTGVGSTGVDSNISVVYSPDGINYYMLAEYTAALSSTYVPVLAYIGTTLYLMSAGATYIQSQKSNYAAPIVTPAPTAANQTFDFVYVDVASGSTGFVFKSGKDAYIYDGTSVTKIGGTYPSNTVPGIVFLDGTYYVMDTAARIWGSDINNPASWPALNVIEAQMEPDNGVAIARQLNFVVAFGVYTTEFFYDAGNATGSPLLPYTSGMLEIGCAAARSIAQSENTLYFLGQSKKKGRGVYRFVGTSPEKISTPTVERLLNGDNLSNVSSFVIQIAGHEFYVLNLGTSNLTLAFDAVSKDWKEWSYLTVLGTYPVASMAYADGQVTVVTYDPHNLVDGMPASISGANETGYNGVFNVNYVDATTFTYRPYTIPTVTPATGSLQVTTYNESAFIAHTYTGFGVYDLVQDTNGVLYSVDPSSTTDAGSPIDVYIRSTHLDGGDNKFKYWDRVTFIGDMVPALASLSYSNDDYQTWSPYRAVDMSLPRPQLYRNGRGRRRAYQLRYCAPQLFRAEALEIIFKKGIR